MKTILGCAAYFAAIALPTAAVAVALFIVVRNISREPRQHKVLKTLLLLFSVAMGLFWLYAVAWAIGRFSGDENNDDRSRDDD